MFLKLIKKKNLILKLSKKIFNFFYLKEKFPVHDYWNDRSDYDLIFGHKYVGYNQDKKGHEKHNHNQSDHFSDSEIAKLEFVHKPGWNAEYKQITKY